MSDTMIKGARWVKGQSGNPSGRPAKTPFRKFWHEQGDDVLSLVFKQATDGCVASQKLILDRAVPQLKSQSSPMSINLTGAETAGDIARLIVKEAAEGSLSLDQAQQIMGALSQAVKIEEATEIEERLTALEERRK